MDRIIQPAKRNLTFDFIRTLAIIFVIFVHSMGKMDDTVKNGAGITINIIDATLNSLIHTGVPLFVMLSGALLLGRDESIKTFFKKRFNRVLIPFTIWSILVFILLTYTEGDGFIFQHSLTDFASKFITSGVYGIYWFIYMLLGLYLITPILRKVFINSGKSILFYLMILLLCFALFENTKFTVLQQFSSNISLWTFYFVAGHIIVKYLQQYQYFKILSVAGFIISFIACFTNQLYQFTTFPLIIFVSIFIFSLLIHVNLKPNTGGGIHYISEISYGIYLSHFIIISVFCRLGLESVVPLWMEPVVMVLLVTVIECMIFNIIKRTRVKKFLM